MQSKYQIGDFVKDKTGLTSGKIVEKKYLERELPHGLWPSKPKEALINTWLYVIEFDQPTKSNFSAWVQKNMMLLSRKKRQDMTQVKFWEDEIELDREKMREIKINQIEG